VKKPRESKPPNKKKQRENNILTVRREQNCEVGGKRPKSTKEAQKRMLQSRLAGMLVVALGTGEKSRKNRGRDTLMQKRWVTEGEGKKVEGEKKQEKTWDPGGATSLRSTMGKSVLDIWRNLGEFSSDGKRKKKAKRKPCSNVGVKKGKGEKRGGSGAGSASVNATF